MMEHGMTRRGRWTRRRTFGLTALLCGGSVLGYKFLGGDLAALDTTGATVQMMGFLLATILAIVGFYYAVKG